jgi:hypothetical protein
MEGQDALWGQIRELTDRLTRLESREVPTAREMDQAIMACGLHHRNRWKEEWRVGVAELKGSIEQLEADMDTVKLWQVKQGAKIGIIVAIAALLGSAIANAAIILLAGGGP